MKISVIIPTYNAEKYLPLLLENLKQQTITFELIIIDSSSTDNTVNIAKKYTKNIMTIPKLEFDHGGTRTKAAKTATGDIIVFLTQDALPCHTNSLEILLKAFEEPSISAVYGRQIPYAHTNIFGKHLRLFNYPKTSYVRTAADKNIYGIKTTFLSDSFAAYRKVVMKEVNWFKDGLIVGEDGYIGAKIILAGYSLAYVAAAEVYHSHSYSLKEEFQRYFDIGVFHKREQWILDEFGKAEGEGRKYVTSELHYLFTHHAYHRVPEFFIRNGMKYLGYKLGQNYKSFPLKLTKKLSLHHLWWDKHISENITTETFD